MYLFCAVYVTSGGNYKRYRLIAQPFSKMAALNQFSHILTTASSKQVVLVSNIGFRGP